MYRVPLNPKYRKRFSKASGGVITIPDRWEDFAPMLTIRSGKGFRQFDPFPMQIELSDLVERHSFNLWAKGRQLGMSEFCLSKILHWALKSPGYNAVVISRTLMDAYKLAKRMRIMIDSIEVRTLTDSTSDITLYNGSRIVFCQPGDSAARGEASVSCVMLDEFSFLKEPELTLSAALPATSMLGDDLKVLLIFTPNGKSNYSFKLLNERNPAHIDVIDAIKRVRAGTLPPLHHWVDNDGWLKVLLHWRSHPVYGKNSDHLMDVARKQKIPWKKVLREHDLSFDESELQYIPDEDIDACAIGEYESSAKDSRYYAGLDSSSFGADYFCFAVLKEQGDRLSLAHLYRARRRAMKRHLVRISELCSSYQIEACLVETNSFGQIYYEELSQSHQNVRWERFTASQKSNIEILERMLMRMETRTLIYPSDSVVLRELRGLEQDPLTGKIEAGSAGISSESEDDELHDDIPRAIALAVACYEQRPKHSRVDMSRVKVVKSLS